MPLDNFNERYLSPLLDKISKENKTAVLLGDFNVDLLKCESNSNAADFLDVLGAHSFVPQILYPTRITKTSKTLIDNIFVNFLDKEICSGNLTSSISDHLPQFMFFSYEHNNVTKGKKNWSKFDQENFVLDFLEINWDEILITDDVDTSFKDFHNMINYLLDKHCPTRESDQA